MKALPGVLVAGGAALLALGLHTLVPVVPLLTASVLLGMVTGQLPAFQRLAGGVLKPGLGLSAKRFMRIGIVLLGLKLSLVDIAGLGWVTLATTVAIVVITFFTTLWLGKAIGLAGPEPLLIATGFSICGASAIGAMSGVVKAKDEEQATPIALVTLCGTLAIFVLPALRGPLGLTDEQFGHWVGASVHDVGQVVATAQIAGTSALAVAVVVKLTRVVLLAPMVAAAATIERRRLETVSVGAGGGADGTATARPPIVPLFVAGFIAAVLIRTLLPVPEVVLDVADAAQTALLAMALFALGAAIRVRTLVTTGWRALVVGLGSWLLIAVLALGAVHLS
ncbi:putative sulfate exporter family transporter [Plantibacter sp. VKM Ac-2880]|uniref:YeiH family protein n=1 Tax=Plantibacter sp. VKM Ac-2880 TaxID=2783827 RepID=UPI00188E932B|nr:putative sulfate exporter family transporter [Plantibacter sp. VKM Ac-2880]